VRGYVGVWPLMEVVYVGRHAHQRVWQVYVAWATARRHAQPDLVDVGERGVVCMRTSGRLGGLC
jgi:hypothetical protein